MSDDEEYYEFEDDYAYEDLVPDMVVSIYLQPMCRKICANIAARAKPSSQTLTKFLLVQDDLAASSYYEAALYEDPGIDVEDYFSDWDYYSDDYYDDDATAEQSAERKKRTKIAATAKRRTEASSRTKHQTAMIPPTKSSVVPDITSFQGVLWKTPALDRDQDVAILYEPDTGDKVALLKNWREVFKTSQPVLDRSRLKRRRSEDFKPVDSPSSDNDLSVGQSADDEPDSSDKNSDVFSLGTSGVDTGDASNTTTEQELEPVSSYKFATPPKVVIPLKRGRKRKAVAQQDDPAEDTAQPPSKRIESRKGGGAEAKERSAPPVRRSARQKK
ncbi:hypothetical protein N7475_007948 [Penicillium sp. IBT 31633x]|nr:hypothetical protein N7475_007948 [Penicillium sp. IBT 31633x]